ncbi:MAG: ATP-binding protein [Anaerolineae bacterium]|nr:ATP-binding protein [Anaerolineae bacterium]
MLIEFSVGNYRSFKEPVTLSMLAAKLRAGDKTVTANNVFEAEGLRMLRSAAIYGANASGKSNLIRAMGFMRTFVLRSSKESQVGEPTRVEPFRLSTKTLDKPSYFQIIFTLNGKRYRYGFELDGQRVHAEWLYHTAKRESRLFIREGDEYEISSIFKEGRGLEQHTRDNALFLSVVAQFNGPLTIAILNWFRTGSNIIFGLENAAYGGFTMSRFEKDAAFRQRVLAFVRKADLGISGINIDKRPFAESQIPEELRGAMEQLVKKFAEQLIGKGESSQGDVLVSRVKTTHKVFDQENNPVEEIAVFDMQEQESQGTRKFFFLSGPILDTLEKGKVLVIDEMEARFHPFLTRAIIALFNSSQTNPRNAQLIFATHDTGLLNKRFFRRDQIWFTEKDRYGATDLYSLAELQIRYDASFDKDYIAGKYGAVPFIGGLRALFEERAGAEDA